MSSVTLCLLECLNTMWSSSGFAQDSAEKGFGPCERDLGSGSVSTASGVLLGILHCLLLSSSSSFFVLFLFCGFVWRALTT